MASTLPSSRRNAGPNALPDPESPTGPTAAFEDGVLALHIYTGVTRVSFESLDWRGSVGELAQTVLRSDSPSTADLHELCDFPSAIDCHNTEKSPEECLDFLHNIPDGLTMKMYFRIARIHQPRLRNLEGERNRIETELRALPQLQPFFEHFDSLRTALDQDDPCTSPEQDNLLAHGKKIYLAHFRQIKKQSEEGARSYGIIITKICLILPGVWDIWSQCKLVEMLREVWPEIEDVSSTSSVSAKAAV
ncbi:hypothetical protein LIA77_00862 [Sarocladium implicatum]|nr:hypothetical protein LIA77_00862 [Sarocladium implicatum]